MAVLLAWCATLLYQKNKTANLILVAYLSWIFMSLTKKRQNNKLDLQVSYFLKAKTDHYPPVYICPSTLPFTTNSSLVLECLLP